MSITAMKQALEALKETHYVLINANLLDQSRLDKNFTAADALRQAIAQAEKVEPVGQLLEDAFGRGQVMWFNKPSDESMLYTHPPTAPAQPLTDEDIQTLINKADKEWHEDEVTDEWAERFARAVEAHIKGASL